MKIVRGKLSLPKKIVVYGADGVGKSTFAAQAPSPIFLSTESGTAHLDVARFPEVSAWKGALDALAWLHTTDGQEFETLVIDSLDWLETVCWAHVATIKGKKNIEDLQYGKGYVFALDTWREFIAAIPERMNVIAIAHQQTIRETTADGSLIDSIGLKMNAKSAALWREWADFVLFATREVKAVSSEKMGRKVGQSNGSRVLKTQWSAQWQAKTRAPLPDTLPLDWSAFIDALGTDPTKLIEDIEALLKRSDDATKTRVRSAATRAGRDVAKLRAIHERLAEMVEAE